MDRLTLAQSRRDAAQAAHDRAQRDLTHARRQHEDRLARYQLTGGLVDPAARLADAERDVITAQHKLTAARLRIEQLRAEPTLLNQPTDRLTRERGRWRARHDMPDIPIRPTSPPATRLRPDVRPPTPSTSGTSRTTPIGALGCRGESIARRTPRDRLASE